MKPHVAPLYARSAAVARSTVAQLPDTVVFTLRFIRSQLESETYMLGAALSVSQGRQVFRTDAKMRAGKGCVRRVGDAGPSALSPVV